MKIIQLLSCVIYLTTCTFSICAQQDSTNPAFKFDHIVFFTKTKALEESMTQKLFSSATKLETSHAEQGTHGTYLLFYNTFIEFLYLKDSIKVKENEARFGSEYSKRWENNDSFCPLGFGLSMTLFDTSMSKNEFKIYRSKDASNDEFYLMSKFNNKTDQPMIYVSMPHRSYQSFTSLEEVDERVEEFKREDLKSYLTHPSGIKNLTKIILTVPSSIDNKENIELLNSLENIEIKYGQKYILTLVFDGQVQGKASTLKGAIDIHFLY